MGAPHSPSLAGKDLWRELLKVGNDIDKCRIVVFHMSDDELNSRRIAHEGCSLSEGHTLFQYLFAQMEPFLELGWSKCVNLLKNMFQALLECPRVTQETFESSGRIDGMLQKFL